MIRIDSPITYAVPFGLRKFEKSLAHGDCTSWPIVGGNAIREAAKMTGITPAMFTRSGR